MNKVIVAMLAVLALAISIPGQSFAQGGQTGQAPQPVGGIATVIGVDQPENCLRIRSGPGNSYDVIGCANMGDQLQITGVWASNDWAQLADNSWVYGPQTDLRPPRTAYSSSPSYVVTQEVAPDYYDWGYLPSYGYDTYWYSGIPIFLYNIGVWNRFHPWWWNRGHHAWWWKDGHHGRRPWNAAAFNNFARSGANRNFVANRNFGARNFAANRSNLSNVNRLNTANLNRFNAANVNRLRLNAANVNRLNTANVNRFNAANLNRLNAANVSRLNSANISRFNVSRFPSGATRTLSTPNAFRSNAFQSRSFSTPTRSFSSAQTVRNFSAPRSFSMGSSGVRSSAGFSARGFSGGIGGRRR
jgi:hypothetical protein